MFLFIFKKSHTFYLKYVSVFILKDNTHPLAVALPVICSFSVFKRGFFPPLFEFVTVGCVSNTDMI